MTTSTSTTTSIDTIFKQIINNIVLREKIFKGVYDIHTLLKVYSRRKESALISLTDYINFKRPDLFIKHFDTVLNSVLSILDNCDPNVKSSELNDNQRVRAFFEDLLTTAAKNQNHIIFKYLVERYQQYQQQQTTNNENTTILCLVTHFYGSNQMIVQSSLQFTRLVLDYIKDGLISLKSESIGEFTQYAITVALSHIDLDTLVLVKKLYPQHPDPYYPSPIIFDGFFKNNTNAQDQKNMLDYVIQNGVINIRLIPQAMRALLIKLLRPVPSTSSSSSTTTLYQLSPTYKPTIKMILNNYREHLTLPNLCSIDDMINTINNDGDDSDDTIILYQYIFLINYGTKKMDMWPLGNDQSKKIGYLEYLIEKQKQTKSMEAFWELSAILRVALYIGHQPTIDWCLQEIGSSQTGPATEGFVYDTLDICPSILTIDLLKKSPSLCHKSILFNTIEQLHDNKSSPSLSLSIKQVLEYLLSGDDEEVVLDDREYVKAIGEAIRNNDLETLKLVMNCSSLTSSYQIDAELFENANQEVVEYIFSMVKEYPDYFNINPHSDKVINPIAARAMLTHLQKEIEYDLIVYYLSCICSAGKDLTALKEVLGELGPLPKPSWNTSNEGFLQDLIDAKHYETASYILEYFVSAKHARDDYLDSLEPFGNKHVDQDYVHYLSSISMALSNDQYELADRLIEYFSLDDRVAASTNRFIHFDTASHLIAYSWTLSDTQFNHLWELFYGQDIIDRRSSISINNNIDKPNYFTKLHLTINYIIQTILDLITYRVTNINHRFIACDISNQQHFQQLQHHIDRIINRYTIFMNQYQHLKHLGLEPLDAPFSVSVLSGSQFDTQTLWSSTSASIYQYLGTRFYTNKSSSDPLEKINQYTETEYQVLMNQAIRFHYLNYKL
ncbi:hypothetical protein DFA_07714 [Cavenderia fasciculata]|uniref:Uncharacterized protein n=1 Tax=Cavenderia fasciculata TaxID=261658 RepID=F4Q2W0_CACFS|nr:uncharacterized protein DFA_07714 [Cavenderia fasciculata]EGG16736.1 hypothetical protein DFA_07714 [Cavenderia fasciculata]|eukprot:XP_004355210.1 hypothetical protein DFA_07714 [Cavenderia fasciculata]